MEQLRTPEPDPFHLPLSPNVRTLSLPIDTEQTGARMREFDIQLARENMISQQIRPWDVLDQHVLDVLAKTPRELFVPARFHHLAFADMEIPLGHGQVMMPPKVEARMLQALRVRDQDRVLEIGTGSGYVTACLCRLARHVDSVDLFEDFVSQAHHKLDRIEQRNCHLETGDASQGWHEDQSCDVIAVTGSYPEYQPWFERNLAIGGRLFVIVGKDPVMEATLIERHGETEFSRTALFETSTPPLLNVNPPPRFVF